MPIRNFCFSLYQFLSRIVAFSANVLFCHYIIRPNASDLRHGFCFQSTGRYDWHWYLSLKEKFVVLLRFFTSKISGAFYCIYMTATVGILMSMLEEGLLLSSLVADGTLFDSFYLLQQAIKNL